MQPAQNSIEIYQLRVVLRETSPHIWRRFLVRSNSSLVELHQIIQLAFDWSGRRAFVFEVQGHRQGVRLGDDAREMLLSDFRLYVKERFTYVYNTTEQASRPWRFELRLGRHFLPTRHDRTLYTQALAISTRVQKIGTLGRGDLCKRPSKGRRQQGEDTLRSYPLSQAVSQFVPSDCERSDGASKDCVHVPSDATH